MYLYRQLDYNYKYPRTTRLCIYILQMTCLQTYILANNLITNANLASNPTGGISIRVGPEKAKK